MIRTDAGDLVTANDSLPDGVTYGEGGTVLLGIRPTLIGFDMADATDGTAAPAEPVDGNQLTGWVTFAKYCGQTTHVEIEVTGGVQLELVTWTQGALPAVGAPATVTLPPQHLRVFGGEPGVAP